MIRRGGGDGGGWRETVATATSAGAVAAMPIEVIVDAKPVEMLEAIDVAGGLLTLAVIIVMMVKEPLCSRRAASSRRRAEAYTTLIDSTGAPVS